MRTVNARGLDPFKRPHATGWLLAELHCALAALCWLCGIHAQDSNTFAGWDWFWQVIPAEDLLSRPWASLWRMHFQPPGYSLWGLFWLWLGGPSHFPAILRMGNMLMGGLTTLLTWRLALGLTGSRRLALLAGLGMAANPAMLLFDFYYLYEMVVIGLLSLSAWCLWRTLRAALAGEERPWGWLAGYAATLNALVLTRPLFHWVFLWAALAFAWPAWRRLRPLPRAGWLALAIALPGLWYAKNWEQYGFFGASSWFGIGLYKCVMMQYGYAELQQMGKEGEIPHYVMERYPYQHSPLQYRIFGFTRRSDLPALDRDDFRNINMVEISRGYEQAAARLIRLHPRRYLAAIHGAYQVFCKPPSRFGHLDALNQGLLAKWEWVVSQLLYGQAFTEFYRLQTGRDFGSLFYFYFPALMLLSAAWAVRRRRRALLSRSATAGVENVRALTMAYLVFLCLYVATVGNMFEIGENMRFRFPTEPFTLIMVLVALRALWRRRPARVRNWMRPDPSMFK